VIAGSATQGSRCPRPISNIDRRIHGEHDMKNTVRAAATAVVGLVVAGSWAAAKTPAPDGAADTWAHVHPQVSVLVGKADRDGFYQVDAEIRDLASGTVLSKPKLIVKAGELGAIQAGAEDGTLLKLAVKVEPDQKRVSYTSDLLQHGEVISRQTASVAL
jgi:hypothetical protein